MRFLVDECTGPGAARWLEEHGHEVFLIRGAEGELVGNFVVASEDNIRIVRFGGESG